MLWLQGWWRRRGKLSQDPETWVVPIDRSYFKSPICMECASTGVSTSNWYALVDNNQLYVIKPSRLYLTSSHSHSTTFFFFILFSFYSQWSILSAILVSFYFCPLNVHYNSTDVVNAELDEIKRHSHIGFILFNHVTLFLFN